MHQQINLEAQLQNMYKRNHHTWFIIYYTISLDVAAAV